VSSVAAREAHEQSTGQGWEPADAPHQPVLFVNPSSGGGKASRAGLADRAHERGIEVVVLTAGQDLASLVREAVSSGADALGVAGGDGSLAIVASFASAEGLPFVCVPAGTRNHFAMDVGVDRHDLVGALDALTTGVERRIDVADVNSRVFLNNVSLGIYGDAVRQPAYRRAKVRTLLEATRDVIGPSASVPPLHLVDDLGREHSHPVVVIVSNNPYALEGHPVHGSRPALDTGRLGIVVLDPPRSGHPPRGREWTVPSLEVDAAEPIHAGIDGEAVDLTPPLRFVIRPRALRVRISSRHPGVSPSGRRFGPPMLEPSRLRPSDR
jgi:diacylglycerol kinase family enzyme